jgi:Antitoxin Phd_YefM, type II toxin-antitoxin system
MPKTLEKPQHRIVNMHEAKTNLSKLVEAVENGENIVIARNGNAHLEPDPFPRVQELDDFLDPFEEKEPCQ